MAKTQLMLLGKHTFDYFHYKRFARKSQQFFCDFSSVFVKNAIYFYDGNMCGTEVQENNRYSWRGDCHTYDAQVAMNSTATNLSADFLTKYKDVLDPGRATAI